jgi:hypothetical protein
MQRICHKIRKDLNKIACALQCITISDKLGSCNKELTGNCYEFGNIFFATGVVFFDYVFYAVG